MYGGLTRITEVYVDCVGKFDPHNHSGNTPMQSQQLESTFKSTIHWIPHNNL